MNQNINLLFKKNFVHEIRSWRNFLLEIVIILIFIIFQHQSQVLNVKGSAETKLLKNVTPGLDNLDKFREATKSKDKDFYIFYTPINSLTEHVANKASEKLGLKRKGFLNKELMLQSFDADKVLAAVNFKNTTNCILDLTVHFPSHFRTISDGECDNYLDCFWLTRCSQQQKKHRKASDELLYGQEGFLPLQHQIYKGWNSYQKLEKPETRFIVKTFESPISGEICFQRDSYKYIWIFYNFIFFVPFLNMLWKISRELEEDMPRHFYIYGFTMNDHWIAHFEIGFLHLLVLDSIVLPTLLLELGSGSLATTGFFFLYLILYNIIFLLNVFILAALVSNARTCILVGTSWWLLSYTILSPPLLYTSSIDKHLLVYLFIFSNQFLPMGMNYFQIPGMKRFLNVLAIQVAVIVVYVFTLKCVERLRWAEWIKYHGEQKKNKKKNANVVGLEGTTNNIISQDLNWSYFEYGPLEGHLLVLRNISVYKNYRWASVTLSNISMKFFINEISFIVGPRNSGKTTLLRILAERLRYHGQIYFEGDKDITQNWQYYRRNVDFFLVRNSLSDLFTVEEQLRYIIFIKSKDWNKSDLKQELTKWLAIMKDHISDPRIYCKRLDGDQRRLLSLCCLLCGKNNNRIILLDEPTRHLTLEGQKTYWRILKQEKLNRIIIVTSDSLEDIDDKADRFGILHRGNLMAWGTSFYLRNNTCKEIYTVIFIAPTASEAAITKVLEKYLPDTKIHRQFHDRIIYKLPSRKKSIYQRMLIELEKEFEKLEIKRIYMSSGELTDVYWELTTEKNKNSLSRTRNLTTKIFQKCKTEIALSDQKSGLFYKKLLYQAPNYVQVMIVMVAAFIIIPMIYQLYKPLEKPNIQFGLNWQRQKELLKGINDLINKTFFIDEVEEMKSKSLDRNWFISSLSLPSGEIADLLNNKETTSQKLGAVFTAADSVEIWINKNLFHSSALALNLAHNIKVFFDQKEENPSMKCGVYVRNEPIRIPVEDKRSLNYIMNFKVSHTMGVILPLTMSAFLASLVDERRNHIDILQRMGGAGTLSFWLTHFVWDYIVYWIITLIYFFIMWMCMFDNLTAASNFVIFLLLGLYGTATLFWVYVMLLLFDNHKWRGELKIFLFQIIIGTVVFLLYREVAANENIWFLILMIAPPFALLVGLDNVIVENEVRQFCEGSCSNTIGCDDDNACNLIETCCYSSYLNWSFPGVLPSIFILLLATVVMAAAFFTIIYGRKRKNINVDERVKQMTSVCYPYDDPSVIAEKVRICNMSIKTCRTYAVLADQLEYEIPKNLNRVTATSFAVEYQQCMGIYSPASSGKSHLIKQLIGVNPIRFGEVYIGGFECRSKMGRALHCMGYCSQEMGGIDGATPRQMLTLFLRLNGIRQADCYYILRDICVRLNLRLYMNTPFSEVPLHIKRRVNVAVALLVHHRILIFDEPTRGMPHTDMILIWSIIRQARAQGNAIIVASRDARELEELSDFIIMVDRGEMLAMGNVHSLRHMYTLGLFLEIKLYTDGKTLEEIENNLHQDIENLNRFLSFLHGNAELISRHSNVLKFYLPIPSVQYSYLFGTMEKNRQRLNISDYLVAQGSLSIAYENLRNARQEKIRYHQ